MTVAKVDLVSMTGQELRQLIADANMALHVREQYDEMQRKMETELRDLISKMSSYAYEHGCTAYIVMENGLEYDVDNLTKCSVKIKDIDDLS